MMGTRSPVGGLAVWAWLVAAAAGCGARVPAGGSAPRIVPPPAPPALVGTAAAPWRIGDAGVCAEPPERVVGQCPSQSCGNGRIEPGCPMLPPPAAPGATLLGTGDESCDGAELGGATCASLGYAGGRLRCSPVCTFDTRECSACESSPRLAACGRADVQASEESLASPSPSAVPFALAATEREFALGWLSGWTAAGKSRVVHFARFGPDLTKLSESSCAGATQLGEVGAGAAVSLVARPGGWLLAATGAGGTTVRGLGPDGRSQEGLAYHFRIAPVSLIAAPDGRTLMLWPEAYAGGYLTSWSVRLFRPQGGRPLPEPPLGPWGLAGALLSADGAIVRGPSWLSSATLPRAVATGAGFVVAGSMNYLDAKGGLAGNGMGVIAVDAMSLATAARQLVGRSAQTPEMVWTGRDLVLIYAVNTGLQLQRLSRTGVPLGPPFGPALAADVVPYGVRAIALDEDSLLLLFQAAPIGATYRHLDLYTARVRTDGYVERGPERISREPYMSQQGDYQLVRCGADAIAAWSRTYPQHAIDLARITP